jgi:uncharacterized protein YkwD
MIGRMLWPLLTTPGFVLAMAILLPGETPAATPGFQEDPTAPVETTDDLSRADWAARAFLNAINDLRSAGQSPPLHLSAPLSHAARVLLDKAVTEKTASDFDTAAGLTREDLRTSGYDPQRWAEGLASSPGEPAEIVAFWGQTDPKSFEAFLDPGLRDFGLAQGISTSQSVYALVAALSRSQANQPIVEELSDLENLRRQLLSRVNEERRDRGLEPLHPNRELDSTAQTYADTMMREGFYGHVSPQGGTVLDRVEASGYRPELAGENIASGPHTAELAMDSWMASKGHRKNILDRRFRDIGFGLSILDDEGELKILWVQCFGRQRS